MPPNRVYVPRKLVTETARSYRIHRCSYLFISETNEIRRNFPYFALERGYLALRAIKTSSFDRFRSTQRTIIKSIPAQQIPDGGRHTHSCNRTVEASSRKI